VSPKATGGAPVLSFRHPQAEIPRRIVDVPKNNHRARRPGRSFVRRVGSKLSVQARPGDRHLPPGGTPDIYGRVMSAELQKVWNQSVVVENRTGAGGTIGTDYVAKAAPDGYTLLFAADATITIAPHLYSKLPYDPVRDLAPIVNVAAGPFVLMANPAFPPNNVKELIALVQTQPGKVSYASSGAGGQQHSRWNTSAPWRAAWT